MAPLVAVSCGAAPPGGRPPPADPPRLVCPQPVTERSRDGEPVAVAYLDATVVGGQSPMTMLCEPRGWEPFPVGETVVTCRVSDSQTRADACTFIVAVVPPPRIVASRYVAFGDSIIAGVLRCLAYGVGGAG